MPLGNLMPRICRTAKRGTAYCFPPMNSKVRKGGGTFVRVVSH